MRADHLSDAEIAGFLDRDLTAVERASVESHLETCPSCRAATVEVRRIADAYEDPSVGSRDPAPVTAPRNRRFVVPAGVAVAAAASLAIVWLGSLRVSPTQTESVRSVTAIAADARPTIQILEPSEEVPSRGSTLTFVWRSAGTSLYRFALMDETGKSVVEREVSDTVLTLPSATPLDAGRLYFWRVDAIADGIAATSGARKLRLAR